MFLFCFDVFTFVCILRDVYCLCQLCCDVVFNKNLKKKKKKKKLYTLEDYAGDPVEGRFYREELQPVTVTGDEVYKIEKVIKTVRKKGQPTQYLV